MQPNRHYRVAPWTLIAIAALVIGAARAITAQPHPYQTIEKWGQLPAGRTWGSTSAVDVAPRGIRVGSARDGKVTAFIPDPEPKPDAAATSGAEGVAADAQGNIFGAEVGPKMFKKYVRK